MAAAQPADRLMRVAGCVITAFLGAGIIPMVRYVRLTGDSWPLLAHIAAFALAAAAAASDRTPLRTLRSWLPLALGPFLYVELRWLIEGVGRPHADLIVQGWERVLFPSNPAVTWAPRVPVQWLSELLHFAYASYYLLVYLPPVILYARGRRDAFATTMFALAVVYGACFFTYLFFPVDGPRYLGGPAAAPDGPIRSFVLRLLAAGSSRGTAFPSSHVAASVVASLCALRYQPRVGIPVALLTVGLVLGTVYGGFHYAVDALAGAVVGVAAWLFAMSVRRAVLPTPSPLLRKAVAGAVAP
jgi:membrane-associated phospholipid phosphatase